MKIKIKDRYTEKIILCGEYESIKNCIEKNRGANLGDANLEGANLEGAYLGGAKGITIPVITITGSRHVVFYHNGQIKIGCNVFTVDEWLDRQRADILGKEANYTDTELEEYRKYIKLIADIVG